MRCQRLWHFKERPSKSISWGKKVTNIIRLCIIPWTLSILSAISPDVWINNTEQFRYVSWTDVTVFTIFFKVGEQNTIDFSSADGLRSAFGLLRRAVLGWLRCKYEILVYVCVYVCVCVWVLVDRQKDRLLAESLPVTFGCFLSDISAVKQTRSNLSRATEQYIEIPD